VVVSLRLAVKGWSVLCASLALCGALAADDKVDGYAEWRHGDVLVVEGQRVRLARGGSVKGEGEARSFAGIPLGYEVKARGRRGDGGVIEAREVQAKPNGNALFENDLVQAFNQIEAQYRAKGRVFEGEGKGYGRLVEEGPEVERVRGITARLVPPYLSPEDFRVYVVDNKEWNAMAAPNKSIYVFSGMLRDMDDDEVSVVLGHELCHATHEHSRRQYKKDLLIQLAAAGVAVAAQDIDDKGKRTAVQLAALLGASAWVNGYGRKHEDQADRVGLRYAYEGGYAVRKGPALWNRFARKYGSGNKAANFFFGSHSVAEARARNLERELKLNYPE
jgi:hypothetical protein